MLLNVTGFGAYSSFTRCSFMGHDVGEHMELTDIQCAKLARVKSLRWIYFVNTNVDHAAAESLRAAMPNTFVSAFKYPRENPNPK